ncbi:pyridoxamine 5'-phosphate oxidase family protein [Promicromonospora sp. NPDC059942]|uniref:pyridoxamine 5'-phosphate oxidase family protein n=1 Tax=Promicromonospora sp. NPDC059942 TaxID=3347009 RepID=UPI00365B8EAF
MEHDQLVAPGAAHVMSSYLTCEVATVSRSGTPVAWPVSGVWRPADQTFVLSTSIGFAQKALNVRRDARVAVLFSDPTGSGLSEAGQDQPGQVLVQGDGACPDEIVTSFSANADLWRKIDSAQPSSRALSGSGLTRRLLDLYYMRLIITVTPAAVATRPALSGAARPLVVPALPGLPASYARELGDFTSGVLARLDDDGLPTLDRVVPEPADGGLLVPGVEARPGPASLLFHRHDEQLAGNRSLVVLGELIEGTGGLVFRPDRVVDGVRTAGLLTPFRFVRGLRARAQAYLDRRGLARPVVAWDELEAIQAGVDADNASR